MTNSSARRFPANPPDDELRENYDAMRSTLLLNPVVHPQLVVGKGCVHP